MEVFISYKHGLFTERKVFSTVGGNTQLPSYYRIFRELYASAEKLLTLSTFIIITTLFVLFILKNKERKRIE